MQGTVQEVTKTDRPPESIILRVAYISLAVNVGLVVSKIALSIYSGSLALRADGIHSFVDVVASIALIVGVFLSIRESRDFPYGLYKVENVVAVAIALLIFFTAFEIAMEAVTGDVAIQPYSGWVLLAVAAFIPIPFVLGTYEVSVGRKYNSPGLIADGKHHQMDVLSSSVVFIALLGQYFGIPLDRVAAVIIVIFVARSGWEILKDSMKPLLDASVDYDTLSEIHGIIQSDPMVSSIKSVTGRNSGRYIFVEAVVEMATSDLKEAHQASVRIEEAIHRQVQNVERIIIHYEPEERVHLRYTAPVQDREGLISDHPGEAPYFAISDLDVREGRVVRQDLIENPFSGAEERRGVQIAEMLLAEEIDVILLHHPIVGKGIGYVFEAAGVEMRITTVATVAEAIDEEIERYRGVVGAQSR